MAPWSSYRYNALGELDRNTDWLAPHAEYMGLGVGAVERQAAYGQLFQAEVSDGDLRSIRECTHKGWALGEEGFRERIEQVGGRRAASKGRGRPKKAKVAKVAKAAKAAKAAARTDAGENPARRIETYR